MIRIQLAQFARACLIFIIDSASNQVLDPGYGIDRKSDGLIFQIVGKSLIRERLANAFDLFLQGAARNSEPFGDLFDGHGRRDQIDLREPLSVPRRQILITA